MKVRILSAVIALAILIPFIWLGGYPFAVIMSVLGILGFKEILDLKKSHQDIPVLMKILSVILLVLVMVGNYNDGSLNYYQILLPIIVMLLPTIFYKNNKYNTSDAIYLVGSIFLIGLFFNFLIHIRNANVFLLVYLIAITIFTDTFAYVIGSLFGKHKMTIISPKKSWEGAVGGLIGGSVVALIIYANFVGTIDYKVILLTCFLSIVGQVGDLFFSKIKRENDIKDFSNIMPGHGGILDRVDSLVFVIYAYILISMFLV